jgi:AAA domain
MAITLAQLNRASTPKPPRILIHGVAGVGKTTFAAEANRPVFIQTEDGLGTLSAANFPLARSYDDVMGAISALYTEQHDFATVVIDSVDWLEPLIWAKACRDNGWSSIEDAGYGKGYVACLGLWRQYVDGLNALRDDRGMTVVQIAHTDIKRFDSPEHDPYDRYVIKLHARAAALLQEHSDVVLFANYRISTVKADVGFNKKVSRAVGSGERVIHTTERPAFLAKNRYDLPDSLPLEWSAFAQAMPQALHPTLIPSASTPSSSTTTRI